LCLYITLFEDNGFIGNKWDRSPNHMGGRGYGAADIERMLEHYGYSEIFSNYVCLEFNTEDNKFKIAFEK